MPEKTNTPLKNVLAIGGFIILLIIGVWSAIQVITFIPRLFSADGTEATRAAQETRLLAEPSAVETHSGEALSVSWTRPADQEGIVSFSYACEDGFYFEVSGEPVPCNLPYRLNDDVTQLAITPVLAGTDVPSLEVPFAITFTDTNGESVRDTHTLTVHNETDPTQQTTPGGQGADGEAATTNNEDTPQAQAADPLEGMTVTPSRQDSTQQRTTTSYGGTTRTAPIVSDPYGMPDLSVELISIGTIGYNGIFQPSYVVRPSDRGALTFAVTNRGTKESGPWYFHAQLPIAGGYPLHSGAQTSLAPGSRAEIRITFDQLTPGNHVVSVYVDPRNFIRERIENNNTLITSFPVVSY